MKVKFVREYEGWPGINVDYRATFDDGEIREFSCSKDEWIVMEIRELLLKAGTDEDLLKKFETAVEDVAREDERLSNMGEEL